MHNEDMNVIYADGSHEIVPRLIFDLSLKLNKIAYFWRPSECRWVNVAVDPIRKSPQEPLYSGPERRKLRTTPRHINLRHASIPDNASKSRQ